jgi:hypothetical protein
MTYFLLALVPLILPGGYAIAQARTRDLNVAEARELVVQALDPSARKLPGLNLDSRQGSKIPDFDQFEVLWDPGPNPGSAVVGHFAVNVATGDVWELVLCRKRDSADLRRLQQTIRKRIGLGAEELHKLTGKAPCEP